MPERMNALSLESCWFQHRKQGVGVDKQLATEGDIASAVSKALGLVQQGLALAAAERQALQEQAAVLLFRRASGLITRRLQRGGSNDGVEVVGMSDEDAEDNLYPTIERFVRSKPDGRASGLNWLYRSIASQALDHHRKRMALMRGGDLSFVPLHGEDGEIKDEVDKASPLYESSAEIASLDDCMERAIAGYEADFPTYANVLRLIKQGLEGDDLVAAFAANPELITDKDRNNFKSRKSLALKKAREYFEPCKD